MQNGEMLLRDKIDSATCVFFFLVPCFREKERIVQFNVASTLLEKLLSVVHCWKEGEFY